LKKENIHLKESFNAMIFTNNDEIKLLKNEKREIEDEYEKLKIKYRKTSNVNSMS
jgi:hypothetical protein